MEELAQCECILEEHYFLYYHLLHSSFRARQHTATHTAEQSRAVNVSVGFQRGISQETLSYKPHRGTAMLHHLCISFSFLSAGEQSEGFHIKATCVCESGQEVKADATSGGSSSSSAAEQAGAEQAEGTPCSTTAEKTARMTASHRAPAPNQEKTPKLQSH